MAVRVTVYGTANMKQITAARGELDRLEATANRNSRSFQGSMLRMSDATGRVGDKLSSLGSSLTRNLTVPLAAAGYALYKATQNAADDARAQVVLAGALRNNAKATNEAIASTEAWITAQGKALGVSDDELRPSLATLVGATKDVAKAQQLATLAMDVAAARGVPVEVASKALAKAYAGQTSQLTKLIPGLDKTTIANKNFGDIARNVASIVGGQASNAANTMAGQMQRNKVAFDEATESLGYAFMPVMSQISGIIQNSVVPAIQKLADWFSKLDANTKNMTVVAGLLLGVLGPVVSILGGVFNGISAVAGGMAWMAKSSVQAYGGLTNFVTGLTNASAGSSAFATPMMKLGGVIRTGATAVGSFTVELAKNAAAMAVAAARWVAATAAIVAQKVVLIASKVAMGLATAAQWAMNVAMSANPIGILIVAIGALVAAIIYLWNKNKAFRDFFINAWNGIKSFFSGLPATFSKIGKAIVDGIMNGLKAAWDNLTGWLGNAVDGLVSGVKNALGIHSPSKVFEGIGGNTADGFARGIEKGRKRVVAAAKATASSAAKAAQASFDRSESMRFANIKAAQGKATDPWAAFDAVTPKPETAAQKAATAAKDLLKQIKDRAAAIMGSFGIGETAQPTTAASGTGLLAALQSQVQAKGNFINNIVALKKAGLAAGVISSLLAAGPAQAGTQASALAGLSSAQLSQYNTAFKTDSAFSTQLATMEKSNKGFKQVTVAPNAVQVTINGNADSTAVTAAVDSAFEKLLRELRSR